MELTGNVRKKDRIIEIGAYALDDSSKILSKFKRLVNNDGKQFTKVVKHLLANRATNSLTENDLANEPKFNIVGKDFIEWIQNHLSHPNDVGILVCHNAAVDCQFLALELLREKDNLKLPDQLKFVLDTLELSKKVPPCKRVSGNISSLFIIVMISNE